MTDALRITAQSAAAAAPQPAPPSHAYAAGHEVRALASITHNAQSPETQRALGRLERVLTAGEPLRTDVPRGFYLNIRV